MIYPWMEGAVAVAKAAASRDEVERLLAQTTGLSKSIRDAFLDTVDQASGRVDLDELASLLRAGRTTDAISLVQHAITGANLSPLAAAISTAALDAAIAREIPPIGSIEFVFDETNPAAVKQAEKYAFDRIRELTGSMRDSIAGVIRAGVRDGRNPLAVAQDIRDVGMPLTAQQSQAVLNYRRALQENPRQSLQRALRDQNFDERVLTSIANKEPLSGKQIDQMTERYRRRYLKYRSETIARTESTRALNYGGQLAWQQAVDDGQYNEDAVVRLWVYTHDALTRDSHRLIPGMNPDGVGLNEEFDSILGPIMYPGDPLADPENTINCRCAVVMRYQPRGKTK